MIWLFASSSSIARFSGFTLFGLGVVFWFGKDIADANIQRNLGIANLVISLLRLAVALYARECSDPHQYVGTDHSIPACRLGYGFMLFLKPKMAQ